MATFCFFAVLLLCTVVAYCQECSGRPPMQPDSDCCKISLTPSSAECVQRANQQWKAFLQSTNKESFMQTTDYVCVSNCFLKNANLITSDNKVNPDEMNLALMLLLGPAKRTVIASIIDTCKERIDNSHSHGANGSDKRLNASIANCDMRREELYFCMFEQLMVNCPDVLWKNSTDCNDVRSYIKDCPFEKRTLTRHP